MEAFFADSSVCISGSEECDLSKAAPSSSTLPLSQVSTVEDVKTTGQFGVGAGNPALSNPLKKETLATPRKALLLRSSTAPLLSSPLRATPAPSLAEIRARLCGVSALAGPSSQACRTPSSNANSNSDFKDRGDFGGSSKDVAARASLGAPVSPKEGRGGASSPTRKSTESSALGLVSRLCSETDRMAEESQSQASSFVENPSAEVASSFARIPEKEALRDERLGGELSTESQDTGDASLSTETSLIQKSFQRSFCREGNTQFSDLTQMNEGPTSEVSSSADSNSSALFLLRELLVFVDALEELRRQAVDETARLRRHNADLAQLLQEANAREHQSFAEHSRLRQLLQDMHSAFETLKTQSQEAVAAVRSQRDALFEQVKATEAELQRFAGEHELLLKTKAANDASNAELQTLRQAVGAMERERKQLRAELEAQTVAQSRLRSERISLQTQLQKLQAEVQRPLSFQTLRDQVSADAAEHAVVEGTGDFEELYALELLNRLDALGGDERCSSSTWAVGEFPPQCQPATHSASLNAQPLAPLVNDSSAKVPPCNPSGFSSVFSSEGKASPPAKDSASSVPGV